MRSCWLLPSIALQVAEQIGGSVDAFVQKMNDRAQELGCTNTVFTNPTGLPDDNQHTTAHDLALIMQAAISNDSFRTISGATSYTIPATNGFRRCQKPHQFLFHDKSDFRHLLPGLYRRT